MKKCHFGKSAHPPTYIFSQFGCKYYILSIQLRVGIVMHASPKLSSVNVLSTSSSICMSPISPLNFRLFSMPIFTVIIESFFKLLSSHYPSSIISKKVPIFSLLMAKANTAMKIKKKKMF